MTRQVPSVVLSSALVVALAGASAAQANLIPGTDVSLGKMDTIAALGRTGTFPNGMNGVAIATTSCNKGTVKVPWEAAMQEDHPFIAFLVARQDPLRIEQISDYSYVKHGFFALTDDYCDTCQEPPFGGGDVLGLGCSDTYSTGNNGDQYWLGPPQEIDPWLGAWEATCSHFDMGEPPVAPAFQCDGIRSLSTGMATALGPVGHRMNVPDQELNQPGTFYYQGYYVIRGEAEDLRENNWGSRTCTPIWSGAKWNFTSATNFANGTVLNRWNGATVRSAKNGNDDGRIYVAVKVTGPVEGLYHYEYAIHNRDNFRGAGALSIPICPDARVLNVGFHDVDADPTNDWTATHNGTTLDFDVHQNPVRWNSFYNVWFDSDAAPQAGFVQSAQHDPGPGLAALAIESLAPTALYNVYLGDGCADDGAFPTLYANGQATLGNPSFALASSGNEPGQIHVLAASTIDGTATIAGCTQWFGGGFGAGAKILSVAVSGADGVATHALPVAPNPAYEGVGVNFQAASATTTGGPIEGTFELTNGLRVRLGSAVAGCP